MLGVRCYYDMETSEKPVQNTKNKRSQSDKIGRLKYNQQLLKQTLSEVEEVKLMLRGKRRGRRC